jgi:hypothetical protein
MASCSTNGGPQTGMQSIGQPENWLPLHSLPTWYTRTSVISSFHLKLLCTHSTIPCVPGDFDDLFALNPYTYVWTNLTGRVAGPTPSSRKYHGFASAIGLLFLFGGLNINSGKLFLVVVLPATFRTLLTPFSSAAVSVTGNQLDLYSLDPTNETAVSWTNLTIDGITARHGHGFASTGKLLYVFGGMAGEANHGEGMTHL